MMLAVFAANGMVMAASPDAEMYQHMAMTGQDCDDCGDRNHSPMEGCELVCASPVIGVVNVPVTMPKLQSSVRLELPRETRFLGFQNPPDPFPPKYLF